MASFGMTYLCNEDSLLGTYTKEPHLPAQACVIWLHGLGADAHNMMGVAETFPSSSAPIRHVFIDAPIRPVTLNNHMPMRAWYDIVGLKESDRQDRDGILKSEQIIHDLIAQQEADGFSLKQIYLAGFSQGGAMALFAGLRSTLPLGGIISLSAYLPLKSECAAIPFKSVPIFMAMGERDQVVFPAWTQQSYEWLRSQDIHNISWKQYPMEHIICYEEIRDLSHWLNEQISLIPCDGDNE